MASRRTNSSNPVTSRRAPAETPDERENQLISAAVDLAERQLQDGSASAQVITHYLKLGSSREKLEQERLRNENALMATKREMMESQKRVEALYGEALAAMQAYAGNSSSIEGPEFDEFEE
jgi:hypothetical protein